jgi:hypothetical protein
MRQARRKRIDVRAGCGFLGQESGEGQVAKAHGAGAQHVAPGDARRA